MDSILEEKRALHEERDRIEVAIVNEMLSKKNAHREKLDSEHRQKALLDRFMKRTKQLLTLYEQPPEIEFPFDSTNSFNDFYSDVREIKEFYNKHLNDQVITLASEFDEIETARQIALGLKIIKSQESQNKDDNDDDNNSEPYANDDLDDSLQEDRTSNLNKDDEILRLTKGLPTTDLVDIIEPLPNETIPSQSIIRTEKYVEFKDEEGYGRYLDLNKCHEAYLQVIKRQENKPNYLSFLDTFYKFDQLEREQKVSPAYKIYVEMLLDYFRDFCRRAKPLFDYEDAEAKIHEKFLEQWNEKIFPGWFTNNDRIKPDETPMVDLETYRSSAELMDLGLDCLKHELQVRGLKCGGTLEERANRLWAVRSKRPEEIDESLKATIMVGKKRKKKATIDPALIASIEAKITMYADYFQDHRLATIENVQRKQARTAEERNESDEDISDIEEDETNQNDVVYNPKNLPLGWDGKPIPYWLYKLHGLNLTFTCEICGNATYKGPKTFQRHFAEWRHAHGMRCLGIPNTAHFANITKIQDAISLWNKLKSEKQKDKFQPLNEEEYEDTHGNVVNKKTFEDLKRQGLL